VLRSVGREDRSPLRFRVVAITRNLPKDARIALGRNQVETVAAARPGWQPAPSATVRDRD